MSHVITVLLLTDAISEKSYFLLWLFAQKHLSEYDGLQNLHAPLVWAHLLYSAVKLLARTCDFISLK